MTKAEKRADFEKCIRILKSRARRCISLGDTDGATRASIAAKRFAEQLAELTDSPLLPNSATRHHVIGNPASECHEQRDKQPNRPMHELS